MLKVEKIENITYDCQKFLNIQGKILKISICCEKESPNIDLMIQTENKETLFNGNIKDEYFNIYPINVITKEEIRTFSIDGENEPITYNKELMKDYFYSFGSVGFQFRNFEQGQRIKSVKIFYEGVVDDGSKSWNFN